MTAGEDRRTEARERALALLYEAESKGLSPREVLAALPAPADHLAVLLIEGVEDRRAELDELITSHARGWTLERMPVVDRNVLRVALFELLSRPEVPTAVIIDEAVELAKRFSTDDSGRFVNGMLSAIAPKLRDEPR
ncbi:MAG TPA: transcription antitermination factor NusB [Acidimicrobiales bacterium]|nr:transcription antitermination factor NusB [Acidimicrobiales bacterium]